MTTWSVEVQEQLHCVRTLPKAAESRTNKTYLEALTNV
jgi:hypothetical protein